MAKILQCGNKPVNLSRPAIMGILNVTPDSFSDGGNLYSASRLDLSKTLSVVEQMLAHGADIIDIGAESSRPGAKEITIEVEVGGEDRLFGSVTSQNIQKMFGF